MADDTNPQHDPAWEVAWAWLMRQHESRDLDAASQAELAAWLVASPKHRQVYDEAGKLWLLSGFVHPVNDVDVPDATGSD